MTQGPTAGFGTLEELGPSSPMLAALARQEARELRLEERAEQERLAQLEEQREIRQQRFLIERARQLTAEGRRDWSWDDPASMLETPEEMATRVHDSWDRADARTAFRDKVQRGEVHLLDVRADEMALPRAEVSADTEELADAWAGRMQQRTQREALRAKIRRWALAGKGARS